MKRAFTLVELLVVITIIVVLLALMMPALDQAIHQAELLRCAGNLKAVGAGVTQYAFDHKRHYPDRGRVKPQKLATPTTPEYPSDAQYDLRPKIRGYVLINKMLNDPLTKAVDLERDDLAGAGDLEDTHVHCSYHLWFGWWYTAAQGGTAMKKVGDRWEWNGRRYSLLANDYDVREGARRYNSHPDDQFLVPTVFDHEVFPFGGFITSSSWNNAASPERGPVDNNYAYEDGSVLRFNDVERNLGPLNKDDRMDEVPSLYDGTVGWCQVPRRP